MADVHDVEEGCKVVVEHMEDTVVLGLVGVAELVMDGPSHTVPQFVTVTEGALPLSLPPGIPKLYNAERLTFEISDLLRVNLQ